MCLNIKFSADKKPGWIAREIRVTGEQSITFRKLHVVYIIDFLGYRRAKHSLFAGQ